MIKRELEEYLLTSDGQERNDTGFEVKESVMINVLVVGRSQSGKTTLVESLKNSTYTSNLTGFSDTRNITHHPIAIRDKTADRYYQINLIDTIGLGEHARDPASNRPDQEILRLAAEFITREITTLNAVIFVSKVGATQQHDISTFQSLMNFLGPSFKANTMMVLTHCESLTRERFNELATNILTHSLSREIGAYCALGIHPHGTLNFDQLETFNGEQDFELRRNIMKRKLEIIIPMRKMILELLIAQHAKGEPVKELQEIMIMANAQRMQFVEAEIRRRQKERCTIF